MYCQTLSAVNHPPNCPTQQFLKVKTACKKACAALVAPSAPPMKSSRKKAMIPSSSLNTGGEACAAGKPATFVRKATHAVQTLYCLALRKLGICGPLCHGWADP